MDPIEGDNDSQYYIEEYSKEKEEAIIAQNVQT